MAPSVTATKHASGRAVSLSVNADGADFYTVYRIVGGFDPAGPEPRFCVRGMRMVDPADYTTCYDTDFPQNTTLAYKVITYFVNPDSTVTSAASATVTAIDLGGDYLLGASTDAIGVPVVVEPVTSWTRPTRAEVVKVRGRRDPVTIGDRRQYPTFPSLSFWTLGPDNRQAVEDLINRYPVVGLSPRYPMDYLGQANALHLTVADVTEGAITNNSEPRRWTLDAAQVGAPFTPRCTTLPTDWTTPPDLDD